MRVFVAGGSGTIGAPLVRALVAAGHQVTALTRSAGNEPALRALGATPAVADALDAGALANAVSAAQPTHVIHQLTALPKNGMVRRAADLAPTNRLRIDGTRNLLAAAIAAGARRFIGGSFAPLAGADPALVPAARDGIAALESMESQILEANRAGKIEGIVLRYGLFYGPDNPATTEMIAMTRRRMLPVVRGDRSLLPCIHMADAVAATVAALDRGLPGSVYNIVDDRPGSMTEIVHALAAAVGAPRPWTVPAWLPRLLTPFAAALTSLRVPLSNEKAKGELGWSPRYPSIHDGLAQMAGSAG